MGYKLNRRAKSQRVRQNRIKLNKIMDNFGVYDREARVTLGKQLMGKKGLSSKSTSTKLGSIVKRMNKKGFSIKRFYSKTPEASRMRKLYTKKEIAGFDIKRYLMAVTDRDFYITHRDELIKHNAEYTPEREKYLKNEYAVFQNTFLTLGTKKEK